MSDDGGRGGCEWEIMEFYRQAAMKLKSRNNFYLHNLTLIALVILSSLYKLHNKRKNLHFESFFAVSQSFFYINIILSKQRRWGRQRRLWWGWWEGGKLDDFLSLFNWIKKISIFHSDLSNEKVKREFSVLLLLEIDKRENLCESCSMQFFPQ
jgi:hypothetical protein